MRLDRGVLGGYLSGFFEIDAHDAQAAQAPVRLIHERAESQQFSLHSQGIEVREVRFLDRIQFLLRKIGSVRGPPEEQQRMGNECALGHYHSSRT
jgi:hypothetical protein